MDQSEQSPPNQCDVLSRRVQYLCALLVAAEALFLIWLAVVAVSMEIGGLGVLAPLALIAMLWIATLRMNSRLVSCGTLPVRFGQSPRSINRPEFAVRMAYHLIINWSVIPLMLLTALALGPSVTSRYLAYLSLAVTAAVWIGFNLQHRRKNRFRNLLSTSLIAGVLVVASLILAA